MNVPAWNCCYLNDFRYRWARPAHSGYVLSLLGVKRLPEAGMEPRYIQGIKVWVEPLKGERPLSFSPGGQRRFGKRQGHRVMAACPRCSKIMSAGRLPQHAQVHK